MIDTVGGGGRYREIEVEEALRGGGSDDWHRLEAFDSEERGPRSQPDRPVNYIWGVAWLYSTHGRADDDTCACAAPSKSQLPAEVRGSRRSEHMVERGR